MAKFQAAAVELKAISYCDVEALKFRDSTSSHDYRELLAELGTLKAVEAQGNYQGKAWKLTDANDNSIIIVEHETGLEILYVVGAIASIVSLVPIIVNTWNRIQDHWPPFRERPGMDGIKIRHFDRRNRLIEEPAPPVEALILQHLLKQNDKLVERMSSLETEVSKLKIRMKNHPKSSDKMKRRSSPDKKTGT